MPKWIHDRAEHLRGKNPGMSKSQSFAIATQQAHASGNSPKGYGTPEGRREARRKYDEPARHYTQTADPKTKKAHDLSTSPASEAGSINQRRPQMHTKLAGRLPLQEMISQHLDSAATKIAAASEGKDGKEKAKEKKLIAYEKKEHGHVPTPSEEDDEHKKEASAEDKATGVDDTIDFHDPAEVEKLASALDELGDQLLAGEVEMEKEADSVENGGEKKQGGQQLPTQSPTGGKQPYSKDGSKKHSVPTSTGTQKGDDGGASTQVSNDHAQTPGGKGAKQPPNILRKTAGQSVRERIASAAEAARGGEKTAAQALAEKIATVENGGESRQGGEQLSNTAPIPSAPGRNLVQNKDGIKNVTKRDAKAPRKAELAQVLTEPAMTRSTDKKVHENLRNAAKGGVKIAAAAAAKAYLQKIAEEGCQCENKGECKHCKLKKALKK